MLKAKFFGLFRVLYFIGKQVYKLKLPTKWKIYDVFHVLLLEQNTNRKEQVDEKVPELDVGNKNNKEYQAEPIWDSAVNARKSKGHLPGLYYLIAWKNYPEKENTWESLSAVQHLKKLISSFHKDHPEKPTATSLTIDFAPSMARPTIKLTRPTQ